MLYSSQELSHSDWKPVSLLQRQCLFHICMSFNLIPKRASVVLLAFWSSRGEKNSFQAHFLLCQIFGSLIHRNSSAFEAESSQHWPFKRQEDIDKGPRTSYKLKVRWQPMYLTLVPDLGTLFLLLLGCLVQALYEGSHLVLLCLFWSCLAIYSRMPALSWRENAGWVDLGWV